MNALSVVKDHTFQYSESCTITLERAGYTHADTTHSSTKLCRFTVIHEGVKVTGDFPSVVVPHSVARGAAGTPP